MNDLLHPCESWAERISLTAAGCLSSDEQREVHRHVEKCSRCRQQLRQQTELCQAIAEAALTRNCTEAAAVERIMSAVTAEISQPTTVHTRAKKTHSTLLSRSLNTWRWIMRSPVFRIATAAILAITIGGIAMWFHGGGTTPAFADFLKPILTAKTVTFKSTTKDGGQTLTSKKMAMASPQRLRVEYDIPNKHKIVTIFDFDTDQTLKLFPDRKLAIVVTYTNLQHTSKEKRPKVIFFELQSQLAQADNLPDWIREPLGEKEIDGRRLIGFRLTGHGMICDLWGDPKTGMPVRLESRAPSAPNQEPMIESDFVFNADLDESLFSMEPPAGYEVRKRIIDIQPPAEEKDLIETLRRYAKLCGGVLPDHLDLQAFTRLFYKDWTKSHPAKGDLRSEKEMQEEQNGLMRFTRGLSFAFEQLPREADAHYAGQGVKLGAADTPIFWYRPKSVKKYRVLYADLSVREADAAPNVPNAQPVVSASGPAK